MPELVKRAVAGSFIFKFPDDDVLQPPQVALFRRSGQVRTYQHKYAPISGSVEQTDESPLATAWRELKEETSLTETSLRLLRQGKPYSFVDESIGRQWTINPFAFVLLSKRQGGAGEAGIKLDWEHESFSWFNPQEVSDDEEFQGVPRLLESLRRVWFDLDVGESAGHALRSGLLNLQQDHESGAKQLASVALSIFIDVVSTLDVGSRDIWWRNVRTVAWHLWKNGRESMGAAILHVLLRCLSLIEKRLQITDGELIEDFGHVVATDLRDYARQRSESQDRIFESFITFLDEAFPSSDTLNILTLSSSSTILSCLKNTLDFERDLEHSKKTIRLQILESRPLFEGVKLANNIAAFAEKLELDVDITVHTDASVAHAARNLDMVLLGADLIGKTGNVSNKTGSLPAVLSARHVSPTAKVVVLSEKEKITPFDPPPHEDNDRVEVLSSWGETSPQGGALDAKVSVKNVYFEWVPSDFIDHYVTEDGITTPEGVLEYSKGVQMNADQYFASLSEPE